MSDISPLTAAQQTFNDAVPFRTLDSETVSLVEATGRTLSEDVRAPGDMPPYNRAIVEGFLVHCTDTEGASEDNRVSFSIAGEVIPGDETCPEINNGQAIRVSTGSILPDGDYGIVRMWEAEVEGNNFTISRPFPPRFFIENRGYDMVAGNIAVAAGTTLTAWEIGLIAGLGINEVTVSRKPVATIFASGDEVIPHTDELKPGQIRDSNSLMLAAAVSDAGGVPKLGGIMSDDFDKFVAAVKQALDSSDMVVIAGGTAIGDRDFISDLLREVGELIIDGVQMRSGRPLIMGVANGKPLVCVAGHPPEALRGFRLFGIPATNRLLGNEAPLTEDVPQDNQG